MMYGGFRQKLPKDLLCWSTGEEKETAGCKTACYLQLIPPVAKPVATSQITAKDET